MKSYIPQSHSTQQCIAHGVYCHIAVRMGYAAALMRYLHSAENQTTSIAQGVDIITVSYSEIFHCNANILN